MLDSIEDCQSEQEMCLMQTTDVEYIVHPP
jgi:hypothetical protein